MLIIAISILAVPVTKGGIAYELKVLTTSNGSSFLNYTYVARDIANAIHTIESAFDCSINWEDSTEYTLEGGEKMLTVIGITSSEQIVVVSVVATFSGLTILSISIQ
jgi:hypothetical protein